MSFFKNTIQAIKKSSFELLAVKANKELFYLIKETGVKILTPTIKCHLSVFR